MVLLNSPPPRGSTANDGLCLWTRALPPPHAWNHPDTSPAYVDVEYAWELVASGDPVAMDLDADLAEVQDLAAGIFTPNFV